MKPSQPDSSPMRFSTDTLPARDREAMWREVFGRAVMRVELEPLSDGPFYADVAVRSMPGLDLVSSAMSPTRLARTPALVADGNDDVGFFVSSSGGHVSQHHREIMFHSGDAVVTTAAEPSISVAPAAARYCCFHIRRSALAPLVAGLDDATVLRSIPPNNEALQYLLSYVRFLQGDRTFTNPELTRIAATHLCDLVALMLGATGDAAVVAADRGLRAARLKAIKAYITDHLDQRGLTVSTVAVRHGITPRYVQLLFESEDTTFSQFVLHQRLARADCLLTDPHFARHSISTIATEAGFDDISYFNRCFRRRYGATPSDIRERAATGHGPGGSMPIAASMVRSGR